jgi:arginine decarboxylase
MAFVPRELFLTKGVGRHKEKLQSFEGALRDAGIAQYNLVRVSSIFPPLCKVISKNKGITKLTDGQIAYCVLSDCSTNEPHRLISSSIGLSIPKNPDQYGYLSEHHAFGETEDQAGDYAEDLAAEMLATILNVPFDADKSWSERKQQWTISGEIVKTMSITTSAKGRQGIWTTVLSCAVLLGKYE